MPWRFAAIQVGVRRCKGKLPPDREFEIDGIVDGQAVCGGQIGDMRMDQSERVVIRHHAQSIQQFTSGPVFSL